jgi:hypothetical protein
MNARYQYREAFALVEAIFEGARINYCPFSFVGNDAAIARGWAQGFPKKLGSIYQTLWSLSGHSGLWPAERPVDLWVHGLIKLFSTFSFLKVRDPFERSDEPILITVLEIAVAILFRSPYDKSSHGYCLLTAAGNKEP